MDKTSNLSVFFENVFSNLECENITKAYIISIFTKYNTAAFDLSKDSITLLYQEAKNKQDFNKFQNLGDWIFFANTWAPKHLCHSSKDYYQTIGRLSYYSCYTLVNKQWKLYEELADNFIILEMKSRKLLNNIK